MRRARTLSAGWSGSASRASALTLIFRHPDVFDAAAAWDAPAELTSLQWAEMADTFGTEANFVQYEIPGLVANGLRALPDPQPHLDQRRRGRLHGGHGNA